MWPESLFLPQVYMFKPWFPTCWYLEDGVWGLQELDKIPRVKPPSWDQCPRPKKKKGERRAGGWSLQTRGVFSPGTESAGAVIMGFSSRTVRNNCPLFGLPQVCVYTPDDAQV